MRALLACVMLLSAAGAALAQQPPAQPPKGPAEIINNAGRARQARELSQAAKRAGEAATEPAQAADAPDAPPADHAADPHGTAARKPLSEERPMPSLAAGSIRVRVLDYEDRPLPGAEINLGIMAANSDRSSKDARAGADGSYTFGGLTTGEQQAYRVNVPYEGAKYSSSPFRLPHTGGYEVTIRRLEVTRDPRMLVLYVGATSVELQDERIKVVQQSRLLNLGGKTYVFPKDGALVKLPESVLSTQTQDSMGDQRVLEAKGEGLRVHGSVPPGEVTLLWGFDLPLEGTEATVEVDLPWPTFAYRVIADAPKGLTLSVDDMPEPTRHDDAGRHYLITEMQRRVGDPPFQRLAIRLEGIPGPGFSRFVALGLSIVLVVGGVLVSRKATHSAELAAPARDFRNQRQALIQSAHKLDRELEAGDIGPVHHRERRAEIEEELALLLLEEQEAASTERAKQTPQAARS